MQRHISLALASIVFAATTVNTSGQNVTKVPMAEIGQSYRVLGRTGKPLGSMVTLKGVVREGRQFKDDFDKPVLQVQEIDGRAGQDCIEVPIRPYFTGFGEPHYSNYLDGTQPAKAIPEWSLPRLEFGRTYEFRGYETGGFEGNPSQVLAEGGPLIQRRGLPFHVRVCRRQRQENSANRVFTRRFLGPQRVHPRNSPQPRWAGVVDRSGLGN